MLDAIEDRSAQFMDIAANDDGKQGALRRSQSEQGLCTNHEPGGDGQESGGRQFLRPHVEEISADRAEINKRQDDWANLLTGRSESSVGLVIRPFQGLDRDSSNEDRLSAEMIG